MNGTEGAKLPSHRRLLLIFGMFLGVFRVYWILKIINISSGIFTEFFSINVGKYLTYIRTPPPPRREPLWRWCSYARILLIKPENDCVTLKQNDYNSKGFGQWFLEWLLPTSEISGSNPVIGKTFIYYQLY